jgi:hypothetical protein
MKKVYKITKLIVANSKEEAIQLDNVSPVESCTECDGYLSPMVLREKETAGN